MYNSDQEVINQLRTRIAELERELAEARSAKSIDVIVPDFDLQDTEFYVEPRFQPEPPAPSFEEIISVSPARKDERTYQWQIDIPGGEVKNIISGISLNDRVLFINSLFRQDPAIFQNTITALNRMETLDQAINYCGTHFPEWKMGSETVYRFMMAVRRKLK